MRAWAMHRRSCVCASGVAVVGTNVCNAWLYVGAMGKLLFLCLVTAGCSVIYTSCCISSIIIISTTTIIMAVCSPPVSLCDHALVRISHFLL